MKKSIPLLIGVAASILLFNCSSDQIIDNQSIESEISTNLSSKSTELSLSKISASAQQSSNPVTNIIDGDSETRWSGYGSSTNLDIDLGSIQLVDYLEIAYYKGNLRKNYFSYWISNDGESWTYVQSKTSKGNTADYEIFDLSNHSTRYIRIECNGTSTGLWNSILEMVVYGQEIEATTTVTTVGEEVTTGIFEINDFDIETSWNTSDKSTEIEPANSVDNEEWYDKSGSTYVLKCSKDDGNRTEWKEVQGGESSLYVNKIMEYSTKITSIPENGVTIAQVHNRGGVQRPLLRVYLEDDKIEIKVTTSTPNESSSSYKTYFGPDYEAGTNLDLKIETKSGKISITATTTSGTITETITPSEDWDDFSNHYYLKAGVYTEGNDKEAKSCFSKFLFTRN